MARNNNKKDADKLKRLTIPISPELHRQLKGQAVAEDTTLGDYVRNLLIECIKARNERSNR
jgi:predicted HicB family RNase H-like nuclease